jgi:acetyl esterase/lipase
VAGLKATLPAALLVTLATVSAAAIAETRLIRTLSPLDDSRGYCLDIAAPGASAAVHARSCQYGHSPDSQRFEHVPAEPYLQSADHALCLTASEHRAGASVSMNPCSTDVRQRWNFSWASLTPESRPDLCVTVAAHPAELAPTPVLIAPVYRRRKVLLAACDTNMAELQNFRWADPDEQNVATTDVARRGIPAEAAAELDRFGRAFNGEIARRTRELLARVPKTYSPEEIAADRDIAYGPDPAQQLDVYTATIRARSGPVPAVIILHGGGLIGGSRTDTANAAEYLASVGFVGVNMTYRRAQAAPWPEGGRDVAAAVSWLYGHADRYGADPARIFVMGLSTGALHAATYVFRPELMPAGTPRVAGAMLLSGPYTFDFEHPTEGETLYFGTDASRYGERVIIGNVSATDIPVLLTTAEYDVDRYTGPFAALLHELATVHGVAPRYAQNLGHNHVSQVSAIGTSDTTVSGLLVDFIEHTPPHP